MSSFSSSAKITIGITCYNAESSISQAIDSALLQDWENFEVLIVDDGSTDNSRRILAKRAAEDSRVRVIEHERNLGCAAARNTLVEQAKGEFLAFFDDDDVSAPERIRLQYLKIIGYEEAADTNLIACYSSGQRIYPNGYVVELRAVGVDGPPPKGNFMADYLLFYRRSVDMFYGAGTPACSMMARLSLFREFGGFDTEMRRQEDIDFAIRLSMAGGHFIGIGEPVLKQYATSGDRKSALVEFESFLRILDKNKKYLSATNSYRYMRLWSEMRYLHFAGRNGRAALLLLRLMQLYPRRTSRHFVHSAVRRFRHERSMNA